MNKENKSVINEKELEKATGGTVDLSGIGKNVGGVPSLPNTPLDMQQGKKECKKCHSTNITTAIDITDPKSLKYTCLNCGNSGKL